MSVLHRHPSLEHLRPASGRSAVRTLVMTVAALVCVVGNAQEPRSQWPDRGPASGPVSAPGPAGGNELTMFATLAEFQAATAQMDMALEDFSALPSNQVSPCYEPVNHQLGQPGTNLLAPVCFQPTQLIPGFGIRSDLGVGQHGQPTFAFGSLATSAASNVVGSMAPATTTIIDFTQGPVAVAMDGYDWQAGSPLTFVVTDHDDVQLGSFTLQPTSPPQAVFAGFISPRPIRRVTVRGAAGASQMIGNLRFGGTPGALGTPSSDVDFGAVPLDVRSTHTMQFTNVGSTTVVPPPLPAIDAPFQLGTNGCSGTSVPAGGSCTIEFAIEPATVGHALAPVEWVGAGPDGDAIGWALKARGTAPSLTVDARNLDFGLVTPGGMSERALTVLNTAAITLDVSAITVAGPSFGVTGGDCPLSGFELLPGESCTLTIGFEPISDALSTGRILFMSNDPSSPARTVLTGNSDDAIFAHGFEAPSP